MAEPIQRVRVLTGIDLDDGKLYLKGTTLPSTEYTEVAQMVEGAYGIWVTFRDGDLMLYPWHRIRLVRAEWVDIGGEEHGAHEAEPVAEP